jgi:hypothetical protein
LRDELNPDELTKAQARKDRFPRFLADRVPALVELAEGLELTEPARIVEAPERYVGAVSAFMRDQDLSEAKDRDWALIRLGYFVGEYLAKRLSGKWFFNEITGSRFFGRYVVGQFSRATNALAMIDPYGIASDYLSLPPGRDLERLLNEVEVEILASKDPRVANDRT